MSRLLFFFSAWLCISSLGFAQSFGPRAFDATAGPATAAYGTVVPHSLTPEIAVPIALPRMAPELALQVYHGRSALQAQQLAAYSAVTLIRAELPDTAQRGEFELQRRFEAPHSLQFTALHYAGDSFVKTNVITRLLQSEVDHVKQDDGALTALSNQNYKFSYKGSSEVNGRLVHVFQLKPRKKRPGLFKGRMYLDAHTGSLVRIEGSVVKSPSFFVKKIDFVQDYEDVGNFTFPTHIHSNALARVIGRTVVDIFHRDYQPTPAAGVQSARGMASPSLIPSE
jgi:hypothetical protein